MATTAEVRSIFESRLKETNSEFHPLDLERVRDEKYIQRVLLHTEKDIKQAADMLWDILIWRKNVGAADINEGNIRLDYINEGIFFPRGRDVDGCLLLIFKSKMHTKGQRDHEEVKKIIIYWLERIEREENGRKITMFFDMEGTGLSNMDMDLVKYLINLFKYYYPYFLNYIIVYNLPWVLQAAFKVVTTLLPAKAVEKLKFLTIVNLNNFVPPDQALTCWGGKDNYVFEFIPENRGYSEHIPKKVTFAEQGDGQHSPGEMLRLVPNDTIIFKSENEEISGQFVITNMDESAVSFKIRTTSPEKFRVRPSSGCLAAGASQTVAITVQPGFQPRTVTKDRFLVMSVQLPKTDLSSKELSEVWQNSTSSKVDEYRLKCHFPEKDLTKIENAVEKVSQKDFVTNSLRDLHEHCQSLNDQIHKLKLFQLFSMFISVAIAILCYIIYKTMSEEGRYCERM